MKWTVLDSRVVYDNSWMTVKEDRVTSPSGSEHDYGHVHFKTKAVAIVPVDTQGNTWLVGQERFTLNEYSWEVPMGGSEPEEKPLQTAHRELKEETGLSAGKMHLIMRLHTSNSVTDEEGFVYLAEDLAEGETSFDDSEDLEVRKLPLSEAISMAMRGEITDAISVAALLRLHAGSVPDQ